MSGCRGNELPDGMDEDKVVSSGISVMRQLADGKYEEVYDSLREDVREQIRGQKAWGKLAAEPPLLVARKSLRAAEKGKRKAIIGFWNKLMNAATKPLPLSLKMKFIEKRWSKISKDAF